MRIWALLTGGAAAVAVVVAILVIAAPNDRGVTGFAPIERQALFPDLDAKLDRVRAIEIESSNRTLAFEKADDEWRFPKHYGHPVRSDKVETVLKTLASLRADYVSEKPSGNEASSATRLDDPSSSAVRVRLLSPAKEVIAGAIIGHELTVPGDTERPRMLVRREQDQRAWLATPKVRIETTTREWLKRDIVDVPRNRVTGLDVIPAGGERVALRRSDDRGLHVASGTGGDDLAGEPVLEATASALERLEFDEVQPVRALPDRTRDDGRTVVATADGLRYTIRWLTEGERTWATIAAQGAQSHAGEPAQQAARFNARHEKWAYRLPARATRYLRIRPSELNNLQKGDAGGVRGATGATR
jgi:hypothetical protein